MQIKSKGRFDFSTRGRYHFRVRARILKLNPAEVGEEKIHRIVEVISKGGVIVYPTDTFYGLGVDGYCQEAVRRLFEIKKRPTHRGLPVIVTDVEMARNLVRDAPPVFEELARLVWPGPLTFILRAAEGLPEELVGPERTIGVRVPAVSWLRSLVHVAGTPLTATSANLSGRGEIASAQKATRLFRHCVDLIVDGGEAPGGLPSTVLDLSSGKPRILREGAFPSERLTKYLLPGLFTK